MFEKFFAKVRVINGAYPELRLQQIMSIAAKKAGWDSDDLFYCPNKLIEEGLDIMIDNIKR